jgi:hypothetical protein
MAQSSFYDLENSKRYQIVRKGFVVLGSLAALNFGAGLIG